MDIEEIKIDCDVPIPEAINLTQKYPFSKLEIGQSFLFPKNITRQKAQSAASYAAIKTHMKLRIRTTDEGVRCWRIS